MGAVITMILCTAMTVTFISYNQFLEFPHYTTQTQYYTVSTKKVTP